MKLGNPAPEPTKIPLKPFSFKSSILIGLTDDSIGLEVYAYATKIIYFRHQQSCLVDGTQGYHISNTANLVQCLKYINLEATLSHIASKSLSLQDQNR